MAERTTGRVNEADLAFHVHLLDPDFAKLALLDFLLDAHAWEEGDADVLLPTLRSWANTMPAGAARAEASIDGVTLRTCDPGARATAGSKVDVPDGTFDVLAVGVGLGVGLMRAGFPATTARCVAGSIADRHDLAEIIGWKVDALPGLIGEVRQDKAACEASTQP